MKDSYELGHCLMAYLNKLGEDAMENIDVNGRAEKENSILKIYTLGQFQVRQGDKKISESSKKSYRLWNLFKYLITQRSKYVGPETLLEVLWADEDTGGNQQALRTLIYRLRKLLNHESQYIIFTQGGYSWNSEAEYWLDVEEFESLYFRARESSKEDPHNAINLYQQAFILYKGDYLPEFSYNDWVMPIRNYYRRIYLDSIFEMAKLLKITGRHEEISKICETALLIEPFEEGIHQWFIEALIEDKRTREAQAHYDYVTSFFYRELGVKPSSELQNLYRRIKSENEGIEMDLSFIQESLNEQQKAAGALLCDPDNFRFFYKLEKRRLLRSGHVVFLGLLTLTTPDYRIPTNKTLKETMDKLQKIIKESLRRGDVICQWNEAQHLLLLPGLNYEQARKVLNRINDKYQSETHNNEIILRTKLEPIQPDTENLT